MRLLEETEKAVGDPQLPVLHRALVDTSAELQRSEQASPLTSLQMVNMYLFNTVKY